jgi:hypothetical protein
MIEQEIPGRGLGIVAERPLHAGETILTDSPTVLYPQASAGSEVCNFCLRWLMTPGKPLFFLFNRELCLI